MYFEKQEFYSENIIDASKMRNIHVAIQLFQYCDIKIGLLSIASCKNIALN